MHEHEETVREIPESFTPQTLARFIADLIRTDSRWWYQGKWFGKSTEMAISKILDALRHGSHSCGTTGCVAGWAAILTAPPGALIDDGSNVETADGERIGSADYLGARALGLTPDQDLSDWLFHAGRTESEVLAALDAIAETGTFELPEDEDDEDDESCDCAGCAGADEEDDEDAEDDEDEDAEDA